MYSLYLYFLVGISTKYFKALVVFRNKKRSYTCLQGIGLRDLPHIKSTKERKKEQEHTSLIKRLLRFQKSISGYGFVLNLHTALSLEFISQTRETCLLLNILSDFWSKSIESIVQIHRRCQCNMIPRSIQLSATKTQITLVT